MKIFARAIFVAVAIGLLTISSLVAQTVAVGSAAKVTRISDGHYWRGILVAENELAPCGAKSRGDDIHFSTKDYRVKYDRPCPGIPSVLTSAQLHYYRISGKSLYTAANYLPPNAQKSLHR